MAHAPSGKKVIGIGVGCLDQLILWEDMSAPVHRAKIIGYDAQGGGMAATAMVTVARLGGQAEFWGAVGTDWAADLILKGLEAERVDTSQVRRVEGWCGPLMLVGVDHRSGERHFQRFTGLCDPVGPVGSFDRLRGAACLLTDLTRPETDLALAREARRLGVPVVADVEGTRPHAPEVLPHVDYAITSQESAERVGAGTDLRAACEAIRALGPPCVVVTLGAEGLVFLDGETFGRMDAFPVEVVDTTGAGDVFHGAFCYGLTEGLPLQRNLAFASAAAAMKCRRLGGRAGIPGRDEIVAFLQERGADV